MRERLLESLYGKLVAFDSGDQAPLLDLSVADEVDQLTRSAPLDPEAAHVVADALLRRHQVDGRNAGVDRAVRVLHVAA